MPATFGGEMKALLWLGLPMALTQLIQFFVFTIDIIMLGQLSAADVSAAAVGTVLYFSLWMLGSGPVNALSPLVSQALGANQNNFHDVRLTVRMTLWVIMFMLPFLLVVIMFLEPMALFFGQDPLVSQKASLYILALAPGWPFALGVMALRNFLAALNKTAIPLVLVIIGTSFNILLNWLLIFGVGPFPALGLVGAGLASSLSYALMFVLFIIYIGLDKEARRFRVFKRFWRFRKARFFEVVKLGWPMSINTFFEGMLFNVAVLIMGAIGVIEQAAYQIGLNVAALAFMLPWGLSMAGAVRIGLATGAENHLAAKRVAWATMITAVIGISIFAVTIGLFPDFVAALYMDESKSDNAQVVAMAAIFLPIAGGFMFFDAVQVSANQLLRGLKDVQIPMYMTGVSYWLIGFPVAYGLGLHSDVGAIGVWYGLMAGLIAASIFLGLRLRYVLRPSNWDYLVKA